MKRLALLALMVVPALAARAQVQAKHFPASAKWMMHLDLKALNGAPFGRFVRQTVEGQAPRGVASFESLTGINLTNDLDALVIYGTESVQSGGVSVVYGRFDVAKLTGFAGGAQAFQNKAFGDRSLLSWNDNKVRKNLCFVDPTIAVMSQDEATVRDAVLRIDGATAGMSEQGPFARTLGHAEGRFLALQANDVPAIAGGKPQLQLFKQAEAVLLEVSQLSATNGVECSLAIKARTPEMAQQFGQAAQGLQALVQLQAAQKPVAAALAQGVKVGVQGDTVSVSLFLTEERLRQMVQDRVERQKAAAEARRAARKAPHGDVAGEAPEAPAAGEDKPARPAFQ